jgi:hypothetical protein
MRSNEDGYGVAAEAVIASALCSSCHQPWFFIGDISPKTENSKFKN